MGKLREENVCLVKCTKDDDCPNGEQCYSHGECQSGCFGSNHCPSGSKCFNNICLNACDLSSKCNDGHYCHILSKVRKTFYTEKVTNKNFQLCYPNCNSNKDCPKGLNCFSSGKCFKLCNVTNQCHASEYCNK